MKCYTQLTDGLFLGNQFSTTIITDINVIISIGCKSKSTIPSIVNYKVTVFNDIGRSSATCDNT